MSIELPILGLLNEKPVHGYDLKRQIEAILGFSWHPSYGSLYPMLRKLEERGLVTKSAGTAAGRQKHIYSITSKGQARLRELLLNGEDGDTLRLRMLFFDQLSADERKSVLTAGKKRQVETLERLEAERDRRAEKLKKYQRILLDHGLEGLRREIDWLDGLIREEETSRE